MFHAYDWVLKFLFHFCIPTLLHKHFINLMVLCVMLMIDRFLPMVNFKGDIYTLELGRYVVIELAFKILFSIELWTRDQFLKYEANFYVWFKKSRSKTFPFKRPLTSYCSPQKKVHLFGFFRKTHKKCVIFLFLLVLFSCILLQPCYFLQMLK